MTQLNDYALMMFALRSAGFEVPSHGDYSPWRSQFWSPEIQNFLRQQFPVIAEQLIQRDLEIPEPIQTAIAHQNPYAPPDLALQRQGEYFFPATCLRLEQAVIEQQRECQRDALLTQKENNAHQIITQRESTQLLYRFTEKGKKVRRSFLSQD